MDTAALAPGARTTDQPLLPVATFWAGGPLAALDKACIASFARQGHQTILYAYGEPADPPPSVILADAAEIAPAEAMSAFIFNGRPNLSHFSDYFRYRLFARSKHAWIDADLLAIRPIQAPHDGFVFACETKRSLCGAIMLIDQADPHLQELLRRTEALMHTELAWGATGPRLLTKVFGTNNVIARAAPPEIFFPIHYDDFCLPLLPEAADQCADLCHRASTLHLWNNLVVSLGYWKDLAPPKDSYLWRELRRLELLHLFKDTYPAEVMRAMVTNWRFRKSGADIGVLKLARQAGPSIVRTVAPRIRSLRQSRLL